MEDFREDVAYLVEDIEVELDAAKAKFGERRGSGERAPGQAPAKR